MDMAEIGANIRSSDNYRYGWNYGTTWKERYKNFGYGFVERI